MSARAATRPRRADDAPALACEPDDVDLAEDPPTEQGPVRVVFRPSPTMAMANDLREVRADVAGLRSEAAQLRGAIDACTMAVRWVAPRVLLAVLAGGLVVVALLVGGALAALAILNQAPVEALYLAAGLPGLAFATAAVLAGSAFSLRLPGGAELSTGRDRAEPTTEEVDARAGVVPAGGRS